MKKFKIIIIILILIISTGCTTTLTDKNNKQVKNEKTGQTITKNILCKPTNKETINIYKKYNIDINKLPNCKDFKITSGKYEGPWTNFLIKPLSFIIIKLGSIFKNYGISVIIVSILIRFLMFPITKKTTMQSELMKKAQPELSRIQKKYKDKKDQESMMKQNTEMMAVYKKYNINPAMGCLFAFIQLPLFIAFLEAIQRTPAIFEDKLLGLHLGTTPSIGITSSSMISYLILIVIIGLTTYISFKISMANQQQDPNMNMNMMAPMMTGIIILTGIFMPSGLGLYWVASNIFTIIQTILLKKVVLKHEN